MVVLIPELISIRLELFIISSLEILLTSNKSRHSFMTDKKYFDGNF